MNEQLILTHNLGTTGNMAVLYDHRGNTVRSWFSPYETFYKEGGRVEQNPLDWWDAVCDSTGNVLRGVNIKSVAAVSFSGQMMGCLCLDKSGEPIGNAIIWADMRASEESSSLHNLIDEKQFYGITGHRISSAYSLSKLLWIRNNRPEIYNKTAKIVQAKDYIIYRLTGRILTDYSDASGTNLLDLKEREWSRTLLSITGIREDLLPDLAESTDVAGTVTIAAAGQTGLLPGTPVVIGAGDGLCSTIAGCCTEPDDAYLYFGSSAWIGMTRETPFYDPQLRTFNWSHVKNGMVCPCGTMQGAGASLDWARDQIAHIEASQALLQDCHTQDLIEQEILQSLPGAHGLLFLPYVLGERSPYWDSAAKGAFIGLTKTHKRADLFRSCYEGVVLNLKIIWNVFRSETDADKLVLLGGQASSRINRQIIADALGIPVVIHNHIRDSKNFGAALIGGMGIGMFSDLNESRSMVSWEEPMEPRSGNLEFYDKLLPIFEDSYTALSQINKRLDRLGSVSPQPVMMQS